jgi:hypothetical protein
MNVLLRILLFLFAMGSLFFILKKVRNSLVQIENAVFWILFMLWLVIISIFPGIVIYISGLIGIESPANFVYLCIIFLLLIRVFNLSLQLSKFQYQIQQLTQIIALEKSQQNMEKSSSD